MPYNNIRKLQYSTTYNTIHAIENKGREDVADCVMKIILCNDGDPPWIGEVPLSNLCWVVLSSQPGSNGDKSRNKEKKNESRYLDRRPGNKIEWIFGFPARGHQLRLWPPLHNNGSYTGDKELNYHTRTCPPPRQILLQFSSFWKVHISAEGAVIYKSPFQK